MTINEEKLKKILKKFDEEIDWIEDVDINFEDETIDEELKKDLEKDEDSDSE